MSRKMALVSIVLLVFGAGSIPGGMIINNYIGNMVVNSIDDGLLGIEEQGIPIIEPMIAEMAIPTALRGIRGAGLPFIEEMIKELGVPTCLGNIREATIPFIEDMFTEIGIPMCLDNIREATIPFVEEMVNATFTATLINMTLTGIVDEAMGYSINIPPATPEEFFNDPNYEFDIGVWIFWPLWWVSIFTIEGVSCNIGEGNLNYSLIAQQRLLYGNDTIEQGYIPGLIEDIETGFGVLNFLELYDEAVYNIEKNRTIQENYNCTWDQLTCMVDYLRSYLESEMIPIILNGVDIVIILPIHIDLLVIFRPDLAGFNTTAQIAEFTFYQQWANCSVVDGGFDFHIVDESIPAGTFGFEVGRITPCNLSYSTALNLWDETNGSSLLNDTTGIAKWITARNNLTIQEELVTVFNLSTSQIMCILDWLWVESFSKDVVPILIESDYGFGMTITEFAEVIFLEQWANGTIMGDVMYENGFDFHILNEFIPEDTYGFEVGRITPCNLSYSTALNLWDETNGSSLLNDSTGIAKWITAYTNYTVKEKLMTQFSLEPIQMFMILHWLWEGEDSFKEKIVPILIGLPLPQGYGMTIEEYAKVLFFEQWANNTIQGDVMYENGMDFSSIVEEIKDPLYGFEVGRITPSNISLASAMALFNDDNPKSLTHDAGIIKWITANTNNSVREDLIIEFELEPYQMKMLLHWLWDESFKENVIPVLMVLPPPDGVGMNLTEFSRVILLEVWANGTANSMALYPYGFPLELEIGIVYGFEVGYQDKFNPVIPTNMSLKSAKSLWNVSNEFSLVNEEGLTKWWNISSKHSTNYNNMRDANFLDDDAMDMILIWLPKFRDNVMPYLAQEEMGLPMDSTLLGNSIQIGTTLIGGSCIGLSSVGLIRNKVIKKKEIVN